MQKAWFKNKIFGCGWRPSSWEGWTVLAFFLAIIVLVAGTFTDDTTTLEAIGLLAVPALLLIAICYMTSE